MKRTPAIIGTILTISMLLVLAQQSTRSREARTRLAVCPTFLTHAMYLDPAPYSIVPTASTAQSLALLAEGSVDYVLAGRGPLPHETGYTVTALGNGYAFLGTQEHRIPLAELAEWRVVTDQDSALLRSTFGFRHMEETSDIYAHLAPNVLAVTSWQNADYARTASVFIHTGEGKRDIRTRTPLLYCARSCSPLLSSLLRPLFFPLL
jgi:hypothetical protein